MIRCGVRGLLATAALAAATTMSASSAASPPVTLDVTADFSNQVLTLSGAVTASPNVFNYQGNLLDAGGDWLLSWNFNASNTGPQAFTAGNYVIQNLSSNDITFEIRVSLPTALAGTPWLYGGSVSGGLTTQGAGSISSVGSALWTASSGTNQIGTLFNDPFSVVRTEAGSSSLGFESFGNPIPSLPGPDLGSDLSITLKFILSGNSSASFTSVFVALVPAPGAVALLGLGGLLGASRRRRA
jgi:hypothetical protein